MLRFSLFALVLLTSLSANETKEYTFPEGEFLEYSMSWSALKVGEATLRRNPNTKYEGTPCLHFTMTARTYGIADKIYKVRDQINSYTDLKLHNTLYYTKKQQEGRTKRDVKVTFDHEKKEALYHNFGKPNPKPLKIRDGILDPLSIMYSLRNKKLKVGEVVKLPSTDGKKVIEVEVGVLDKEKVKVPAGKFTAFRLAPATKDLRGVFKKSKDAKIELWVSETAPHYPLKMKSKVIVGSFSGKLVKITKPKK